MDLSRLSKGEYSSAQWLAIAPLLALSASLTTSLIAGVMTFLLLTLLSVPVSLLRFLVPKRLCLPVIILLLGTLSCLMIMGIKFYFYGLNDSFNIYLPLLAVNSLIYAIGTDYFIKKPWTASLRQALISGTVFLILFAVLGLFREALGYGTLFRDIGMVGREAAGLKTIHLIDGFTGIPLIHSPPGALICCGLLAALIKFMRSSGYPRAAPEIH